MKKKNQYQENLDQPLEEDHFSLDSNKNNFSFSSLPRVGLGYDVHALVPDRPLILGGEGIPFEKGLLGHSDADVLIHAVMDAMLGALALGDIGQLFPDTDPLYKGISSRKLLRQVKEKVKTAGYGLGNIDAVICCERPKLSPYIPKMRENLAEDLECRPSQISIKATTTEKLGFVGREEGIAAKAICLLYPL